jgi:hypothetical protein
MGHIVEETPLAGHAIEAFEEQPPLLAGLGKLLQSGMPLA